MIFRKVKDKRRYDFRDAQCIGLSCWAAGLYQHRSPLSGGGSRNTGSPDSPCCLNRAYHGCPSPLPVYDQTLKAKRTAEGWRKANEETVMKILTLTLVLLTTTAYADQLDRRLFEMKRVAVLANDPLEDDAPVVVCLIEHLPLALPLTVVDPDDADVVIRVSARVNGQTSRKIGALIGGQSSVSLGSVGTSAWIDGKKVWKDGSSVDEGAKVKRTATEDFCSLADASINDIRKAMKKARGK